MEESYWNRIFQVSLLDNAPNYLLGALSKRESHYGHISYSSFTKFCLHFYKKILTFILFHFPIFFFFSSFPRSGENLIKVDLTDTDNIDKFIQETKPDVLIHSAAQRFPDQIQKNPESARKLNVDATMKMAASMSKFFLKVVFS